MLRTCMLCKTNKDLEEFNKDPHGKYGRRARCKACERQVKNERYHANKTVEGFQLKQSIRVASSRYDENGTLIERRCRRCREFKPASEFYFERKYDCKPCEVIYNRFQRHGISEGHYNDRRKDQDFCCATCGKPEINSTSLVIDHDHSCCPKKGRSCGKCIRGLLCPNCNVAIGFLEDNPETAQKIVQYLTDGGRKVQPLIFN